MKKNKVLILLFVAIQIHAQPWKMVWSDEFNYEGLPDSTKWVHETGNIRNSELEYYTNRRSENSTVEKGNLLIIGRKEKYEGSDYTSARLTTDGKYSLKYGKIEARIQLPVGKGIWPAFWLLGQNIKEVGSPKCGEIDILEHVNTENKIHCTMHWDNDGLVSFGDTKTCDVRKFHRYGVEWNEDKIKWYLDGRKYFEGKIKKEKSNTDEFQNPFYIILNMAIGGSWPGNPDSTTIFPDTMRVDYVRVYQKTR